jgi:hypothetical protein
MTTHPSARTTVSARVRTVRPSLLDLRFREDVWITDEGDGVLYLSLGLFPLAHIQGTGLDVVSLNRLLQHARRGRPRRPDVTRR